MHEAAILIVVTMNKFILSIFCIKKYLPDVRMTKLNWQIIFTKDESEEDVSYESCQLSLSEEENTIEEW